MFFWITILSLVLQIPSAFSTDGQIKDQKKEYIYIMRAGDTMFNVAQICRFKTQNLLDFNGIKDAATVKVGAKIKFPKEIWEKCNEKLKSRQLPNPPVKILLVNSNAQNSAQLATNVNQKMTTNIKNVATKDKAGEVVAGEKKSLPIVLSKAYNKCLAFNIPMPMKGSVEDTFGKEGKHSTGIVIKTKNEDEPVRSVADGKVVYVGDSLSLLGQRLIIVSHFGFFSAYSFGSKNILIKEKDRVKEGQIIGYLNNADEKMSYLHFSLRSPNGLICNPLELLNKS